MKVLSFERIKRPIAFMCALVITMSTVLFTTGEKKALADDNEIKYVKPGETFNMVNTGQPIVIDLSEYGAEDRLIYPPMDGVDAKCYINDTGVTIGYVVIGEYSTKDEKAAAITDKKYWTYIDEYTNIAKSEKKIPYKEFECVGVKTARLFNGEADYANNMPRTDVWTEESNKVNDNKPSTTYDKILVDHIYTIRIAPGYELDLRGYDDYDANENGYTRIMGPIWLQGRSIQQYLQYKMNDQKPDESNWKHKEWLLKKLIKMSRNADDYHKRDKIEGYIDDVLRIEDNRVNNGSYGYKSGSMLRNIEKNDNNDSKEYIRFELWRPNLLLQKYLKEAYTSGNLAKGIRDFAADAWDAGRSVGKFFGKLFGLAKNDKTDSQLFYDRVNGTISDKDADLYGNSENLTYFYNSLIAVEKVLYGQEEYYEKDALDKDPEDEKLWEQYVKMSDFHNRSNVWSRNNEQKAKTGRAKQHVKIFNATKMIVKKIHIKEGVYLLHNNYNVLSSNDNKEDFEYLPFTTDEEITNTYLGITKDEKARNEKYFDDLKINSVIIVGGYTLKIKLGCGMEDYPYRLIRGVKDTITVVANIWDSSDMKYKYSKVESISIEQTPDKYSKDDLCNVGEKYGNGNYAYAYYYATPSALINENGEVEKEEDVISNLGVSGLMNGEWNTNKVSDIFESDKLDDKEIIGRYRIFVKRYDYPKEREGVVRVYTKMKETNGSNEKKIVEKYQDLSVGEANNIVPYDEKYFGDHEPTERIELSKEVGTIEKIEIPYGVRVILVNKKNYKMNETDFNNDSTDVIKTVAFDGPIEAKIGTEGEDEKITEIGDLFKIGGKKDEFNYEAWNPQSILIQPTGTEKGVSFNSSIGATLNLYSKPSPSPTEVQDEGQGVLGSIKNFIGSIFNSTSKNSTHASSKYYIDTSKIGTKDDNGEKITNIEEEIVDVFPEKINITDNVFVKMYDNEDGTLLKTVVGPVDGCSVQSADIIQGKKDIIDTVKNTGDGGIIARIVKDRINNMIDCKDDNIPFNIIDVIVEVLEESVSGIQDFDYDFKVNRAKIEDTKTEDTKKEEKGLRLDEKGLKLDAYVENNLTEIEKSIIIEYMKVFVNKVKEYVQSIYAKDGIIDKLIKIDGTEPLKNTETPGSTDGKWTAEDTARITEVNKWVKVKNYETYTKNNQLDEAVRALCDDKDNNNKLFGNMDKIDIILNKFGITRTLNFEKSTFKEELINALPSTLIKNSAKEENDAKKENDENLKEINMQNPFTNTDLPATEYPTEYIGTINTEEIKQNHPGLNNNTNEQLEKSYNIITPLNVIIDSHFINLINGLPYVEGATYVLNDNYETIKEELQKFRNETTKKLKSELPKSGTVKLTDETSYIDNNVQKSVVKAYNDWDDIKVKICKSTQRNAKGVNQEDNDGVVFYKYKNFNEDIKNEKGQFKEISYGDRIGGNIWTRYSKKQLLDENNKPIAIDVSGEHNKEVEFDDVNSIKIVGALRGEYKIKLTAKITIVQPSGARATFTGTIKPTASIKDLKEFLEDGNNWNLPSDIKYYDVEKVKIDSFELVPVKRKALQMLVSPNGEKKDSITIGKGDISIINYTQNKLTKIETKPENTQLTLDNIANQGKINKEVWMVDLNSVLEKISEKIRENNKKETKREIARVDYVYQYDPEDSTKEDLVGVKITKNMGEFGTDISKKEGQITDKNGVTNDTETYTDIDANVKDIAREIDIKFNMEDSVSDILSKGNFEADKEYLYSEDSRNIIITDHGYLGDVSEKGTVYKNINSIDQKTHTETTRKVDLDKLGMKIVGDNVYPITVGDANNKVNMEVTYDTEKNVAKPTMGLVKNENGEDITEYTENGKKYKYEVSTGIEELYPLETHQILKEKSISGRDVPVKLTVECLSGNGTAKLVMDDEVHVGDDIYRYKLSGDIKVIDSEGNEEAKTEGRELRFPMPGRGAKVVAKGKITEIPCEIYGDEIIENEGYKKELGEYELTIELPSQIFRLDGEMIDSNADFELPRDGGKLEGQIALNVYELAQIKKIEKVKKKASENTETKGTETKSTETKSAETKGTETNDTESEFETKETIEEKWVRIISSRPYKLIVYLPEHDSIGMFTKVQNTVASKEFENVLDVPPMIQKEQITISDTGEESTAWVQLSSLADEDIKNDKVKKRILIPAISIKDDRTEEKSFIFEQLGLNVTKNGDNLIIYY